MNRENLFIHAFVIVVFIVCLLNSISMWSLLILLISVYYKNNIATKIANLLYKYYDKKRKEKLNINSVDNKNK